MLKKRIRLKKRFTMMCHAHNLCIIIIIKANLTELYWVRVQHSHLLRQSLFYLLTLLEQSFYMALVLIEVEYRCPSVYNKSCRNCVLLLYTTKLIRQLTYKKNSFSYKKWCTNFRFEIEKEDRSDRSEIVERFDCKY